MKPINVMTPKEYRERMASKMSCNTCVHRANFVEMVCYRFMTRCERTGETIFVKHGEDCRHCWEEEP